MELNTKEKIQVIRKRKGMSMEQLAELAGETRQNLSRKLSVADLKESDIAKYAEILGCRAEVKFIDTTTGEEL